MSAALRSVVDDPEIEQIRASVSVKNVSRASSSSRSLPLNDSTLPLAVVERLAIQQTLEACGGNKALAARTLGITEKSIYNKMTRLGLR